MFGGSSDKTVTFTPDAYSEKKLASGSMKYGIKHGNDWYGSFDEQHGVAGKAAHESKTQVTLSWEFDKTGKYKNIVTLTA